MASEAPERIWVAVTSEAENWTASAKEALPDEIEYVRADLAASTPAPGCQQPDLTGAEEEPTVAEPASQEHGYTPQFLDACRKWQETYRRPASPRQEREALEKEIAAALFAETFGGTSDPDLTDLALGLAETQARAVADRLTTAGYVTPSAPGCQQPEGLTVRIEPTAEGLWRATSPQDRGLHVVGKTPAGALWAAANVLTDITEMQRGAVGYEGATADWAKAHAETDAVTPTAGAGALDRFGLALLMIREGVGDPRRVAADALTGDWPSSEGRRAPASPRQEREALANAGRLSNYPDYTDDLDGLEALRQQVLEARDRHDMAVLNLNSLARLAITRLAAGYGTPSAHAAALREQWEAGRDAAKAQIADYAAMWAEKLPEISPTIDDIMRRLEALTPETTP